PVDGARRGMPAARLRPHGQPCPSAGAAAGNSFPHPPQPAWRLAHKKKPGPKVDLVSSDPAGNADPAYATGEPACISSSWPFTITGTSAWPPGPAHLLAATRPSSRK